MSQSSSGPHTSFENVRRPAMCSTCATVRYLFSWCSKAQLDLAQELPGDDATRCSPVLVKSAKHLKGQVDAKCFRDTCLDSLAEPRFTQVLDQHPHYNTVAAQSNKGDLGSSLLPYPQEAL